MINGKKLERLTLPPGIAMLTPTEALNRIDKFLQQVPRLKAIIIVGREGSATVCHCRPSRDLPDSRIREMLVASLRATDAGQATTPAEQHERVIVIPGMRQLSLKEATERIQNFVDACPGMTCVLLLCPDGNLDKLRKLHSSNVDRGYARELIRLALTSFVKDRGLPPPLA